jgi:hypothetical protein
MAEKRKRVKPGDVLEFATNDERAYLHYIGKHSEYGDAVVVCPERYEKRPANMTGIFDSGYVVFYPVTAAAAQGFIDVVGYLAPRAVPVRLRRPGARRGNRIETWIIEDDSAETLSRQLSEEERLLPIAVIWNHEMLVHRVREGWRPEWEGIPAKLLVHYLYFPDKKTALKVAHDLRNRGFRTEERLGADGVNWLVLASHNVVLSEEMIRNTRQLMEQIVAATDGEYDGWEAEATQ